MNKLNLNNNLINLIVNYIGYSNIKFNIDVSKIKNWKHFVQNENLPESFFFENEDKSVKNIRYIVERKNIPFNFITKHKKLLTSRRLECIYRNSNTPSWFIENDISSIDKNNWFRIIHNNKILPFGWYENNIDIILLKVDIKILIQRLSRRIDITVNFIRNYKNQISNIGWLYIINSDIIELLFQKHKDLIPSSVWDKKFCLYENNFNQMKKIINIVNKN
jgi:hypothetical protein